jgi:predicted nucleic acid-binding protein
MNMLRIYYLDSSAILKLIIDEPGSDKLFSFLRKPHNLKTTAICFAEALGRLKKKYFDKDRRKYLDTVYVLLAYFRENIKIDTTNLHDRGAFDEVERIVDEYGKIGIKVDVSDAFQIYILKNELNHSIGKDTILITADEGLAKAARLEGLEVWDCLRENIPI